MRAYTPTPYAGTAGRAVWQPWLCDRCGEMLCEAVVRHEHKAGICFTDRFCADSILSAKKDGALNYRRFCCAKFVPVEASLENETYRRWLLRDQMIYWGHHLLEKMCIAGERSLARKPQDPKPSEGAIQPEASSAPMLISKRKLSENQNLEDALINIKKTDEPQSPLTVNLKACNLTGLDRTVSMR